MKTTMNLKKVCCKVVKQYFSQHNHTSCYRARNGEVYKGSELNFYFSNKPFVPDDKYFCCYNLDRCLKAKRIPKAKPLARLASAVQSPSISSINEADRPEFKPKTERGIRKLVNDLKKAEKKIQDLKEENNILRSSVDDYYQYVLMQININSTDHEPAKKKARYN